MKIRTKLILTFSFFVISFLIFGILINVIFDKEAREHALIHAEIYAHTFALTIGRETKNDNTPPLFFNREALEDYVQDVYSTQKIDIVVVDTAKTIIADAIKSEIGKKYNYDKNNEVLLTMRDGLDRTFKEVNSHYPGGIFLYVHPIKTENGKTLGAVLIEYTAILKESEAGINKVRQIVLYVILFLIFVAIAFGFVISKIITGAISDLVNAARKFSQGDYSVRIKTERKDELGELGKAFNLMVGQKQISEEALKASEEKYRLVFTNVPLGIAHYNSKGIITDCNDVFLEILGLTKEDALGFNIIQIENLKLKKAYELALSGIMGNYEGDYKSIVSKKIISLKVSFAPNVHEEGKIFGVVGIFEDISERKQIERFFFHDILNTAGNLRNYSELLNDDLLENKDKDSLNKQLLTISNQIIEEIISHKVILLSDKTELKVNIVAINTLEFIKNIIINFKQMADRENKQISISKKFEDIEIKTDRVLLSRILSNLIKNAIEASQTGGTITIGCCNEDGQIKLWVHNQTGIPEEIKPKIFHRSFSTKGAGRGIGTYSIKFLTEKYLNGKVFFTSTEKEGTTFYVCIPPKI
ncbi:MAG: sensor histidine kinase [Ignavibacteriaceae bacterium]